jgi:hypothetical protein
MFLFYYKPVFPIWGDNVPKSIRVSSDLWAKYMCFSPNSQYKETNLEHPNDFEHAQLH